MHEMGRSAGVEWVLGRFLSALRDAGIVSGNVTAFEAAVENVAKPIGLDDTDTARFYNGVTEVLAAIDAYSNMPGSVDCSEGGAAVKELIRAELIGLARRRETITYGILGHKFGLDVGETEQRNHVSNLLDDINRDELRAERPMLSSIVVSAGSGMPGSGYFNLARRLELYDGNDDRAFWEEQVERVFDYWS